MVDFDEIEYGLGDDWFETNRKTKAPALQYDDWDTGDQYL